MAKCRSCGAEIRFIQTPAGKMHPIDAKPIKVWQQDDGRGDPGRWGLVDGYVSHFSTCPHADQHRKRNAS